MIEIIPAILPKNYEDLKDKIALVRGVVPIVQIDICDGIFVKNMTWPFIIPPLEISRHCALPGVPGGTLADAKFQGATLDMYFQNILNEQEGMPFWEDIDFELDLMVTDTVENFDVYTKLGPKRIVFHLEAVGDLEIFKEFLEGLDNYIRDAIQIGVAISVTTSLEKIFPMVPLIDFVQVMGIEKIGYQGEDFTEKSIEYIKILKEKFTDLVVSVDGGINFETAPEVIEAGADRLIIGSAIFNTDDIIDTIENFKNINSVF